MERRDPPSVATFYSPDPLVASQTTMLGEEVAHHMRVRRMEPGDVVRLVDGVGHRAMGTLRRLAKGRADVELSAEIEVVPAPSDIHLLVPVADRDRMLWLAEKAAEIGVTSWRPVSWRRSRSVSPRGEGAAFHAKVRARMVGALEQSGGAWLPALYPDGPLERALSAIGDGARLLLSAGGAPMLNVASAEAAAHTPVVLAVGPEGGMEADEVEKLVAVGFREVSLGDTVLRFETAAIVALGLVRAAFHRSPES